MWTAILSIAFSMGALASVDGVCAQHPERVRYLFERLDLGTPGLEETAAAAEAEDWPAACAALLDYYRAVRLPAYHARHGYPQPITHSQQADLLLDDVFVYFGKEGKVPRLPHGGWDWEDRGPEKDREWAWGMNRHFHLRTLLQAWQATGEDKYLAFLHENLRDWLVTSDYVGKKTLEPRWRGLETALRMNSWPQLFFELLETPGFSDAARILLLSRLPEHAHYLRNFHAQRNWLTMEMNGLATIAVAWPEFKGAPAWAAYAAETAGKSMLEQVYPDGVQKELTSHYHRVALRNFKGLADLFEGTPHALPAYYRPTLERMCAYLAFSMRPDGHGVLNNDSDLDYTREHVLGYAREFDRPDWTCAATNGAEGEPAAEGPSFVFPWAGQAVLRSGWDADARWCFFDIGPFGIGHQHHDKLHFSIHAHGRDLLVDSGRYTYVGGPWREYFKGPRAHNLLLIDGCGQGACDFEAKAPVDGQYALTGAWDYARGRFDGPWPGLEGEAAHTRALVHVKDSPAGDYFVAVDRVETGRPRRIEALWQFHPDCTVVEEDGVLRTVDEDAGNLALAPAGGPAWRFEQVRGREDPDIQGWYSPGYYEKTPATTAIASADIGGAATFAWVIRTARGLVEPPERTALDVQGDIARVTVAWADHPPQTVFVPLDGEPIVRVE